MNTKFIRFIAGAICPSCKMPDKIALTPDDNKIYCLNCSFEESRPEAPKIAPKNLDR